MGKNNSIVMEAGKMSIFFVVWAVFIIITFASFISPILSSTQTPLWLIAQGIIIFLVVTGLFGWIAVSFFFRNLRNAKKLNSNNLNEWVLLIAILAAAFTIGGIFQAVSTIGSQTVSISSCIDPPDVNVTSLNCVKTQIVSHVEGPNLYFGQLGLDVILLSIVGTVTFLMSCVALFLKTLPVKR